MLTWDETKEAVRKAQATSSEDFSLHLASYVAQGAIEKLIDDYVSITVERLSETLRPDEYPLEYIQDRVAHEAAIFMTGVQVGWYMGEGAFRSAK